MSRQAQGWKLRKTKGNSCYSIRFWHPTKRCQVELGTGETDAGRAAARGAQIYAEELRGNYKQTRKRRVAEPPLSFLESSVKWLKSMASTIDPGTIASYALYLETHWAPHFPSLLDVTTVAVKCRISERLLLVKADTVRKELSALRGLMSWCVESGILSDAPEIPGVPKRVQGNAFAKRRRSKPGELSQREVSKFLAALPVSTPRLGWVRARFTIEYEMALRPSLMDRLACPEHWKPGSDFLDLPAAAMKGRRASRKRLTRAARLALDSLDLDPMTPGLIFGAHDYRETVRKAAIAALGAEKASTFTAAHLRSAGITHFLERGAALPAAQALADHKHASTTDRYVRASEKAIEAELKRQGRI